MAKQRRQQELDALDDILGTSAQKTKKRKDNRTVVSVGVTLDRDSLAAYEKIAKECNASRNALMRHALVTWLELYRAGKVELTFEVEQRLKV